MEGKLGPLITRPLNGTQIGFNDLCTKGGGQGGGPLRGKVQELMSDSGKALNAFGVAEVQKALDNYAQEFNPWHVCFAVGLAWGHLAHLNPQFVGAAVRLLANWNADDLAEAKKHHNERGPDPIEQSLKGGYMMFQRVRLPPTLPDSLDRLRHFQERWWSPILSQDRPLYIGSWNATAMFMIALFAQPTLAATMTEVRVLLPPGGPIYNGLKLLYEAKLLSRPPAGSDLDDEAVEPGAVYENNALFAEIQNGKVPWSLIDVHSGLYMLGTRFAPSGQWF